MRITKISVKKLFGILDHEIPLNQESRITIIHGPNGFGKTILLTMLNALFNSNFRVFREIPFKEFRVFLDHHEFLSVTPDKARLKLSFTTVTGVYSFELHQDADGEANWLSEIKGSVNVELIKTQRLQTEVAIEQETLFGDAPFVTRVVGPAVEEYAAKAANLVHNVHGARNLALSQVLELRPLLNNLIELLDNNTTTEALDKSEFENQLEYVKSTLEIIKMRDTEITNSSNRLRMLVELLNGHFIFKRVFADDKSGLIFLSSDSELIPAARLSSGEQHLLVLYSKLLFDIPPNSLVLIDEPELSLHVTWQHDFLNDLKRIIDLCDFDVLITTHSPPIVHDKWDWMVDLHNPEADYSDDVAEYA